jgi:hypothetical protein
MSVKRIIYQMGRFDSSIDMLVKVNFEIDDEIYSWRTIFLCTQRALWRTC